MKKIIFVAVILVLLLAGYSLGLHTYFVRTDVQESLPQVVNQNIAEPVREIVLAVGTFGEIDIIHKGSGQAKLIEVNGKKFLRLENFSVTSGPDLYVYLSKSVAPTSKIESLGDFIDLGVLKGTSGNQNYEITGNVDGYRTAVIWCKRFGVLFSYAVMQ